MPAAIRLRELIVRYTVAKDPQGLPVSIDHALIADPRAAAVDPQGRYHHLANLHVLDGSLFPTSIGANPQLSIYAVVAKLATALAASIAT